MVETAPRIVLVTGDKVSEIRANGNLGARFLGGITNSLAAAIEEGSLISAEPFVKRPEENLPTPEELVEGSGPIQITAERTLELAIAKFQASMQSRQGLREALGEFEQAHWNVKREPMGVSQRDLAVPEAPYSDDQIIKFMGLGRRFRKTSPDNFGLYLPEITSTAPHGLVLLGKGNPLLTNSAFQEGTRVKNVDNDGNIIPIWGWMITEKDIDAPHLKTNQVQAEEIVRKAHRIGDTLNVYADASEQSKQLFDQYLDEVKTWIRALSSRRGGQVLDVDFYSFGVCCVRWGLESGLIYDYLGLRSVEVAKT